MLNWIKRILRALLDEDEKGPYQGKNVTSGITVSGDLHIKNGKVFVDGKEYVVPPSMRKLEIVLVGDAARVQITEATSVTVKGSVTEPEVISADVCVKGNIPGNVQTVSGGVSAKNITGQVSTVSGYVSRWFD